MKHPIFYAALSVLLLAGCVRSDVTRFHNLPKSGGGKTIVILPSDPAKKGGIEFRTYAQIVAAYFAKNGYVVLPPSNPNADFAAFFDYSIGAGKTGVGSTPIIGQTGGGTTYQSGTITGSTYGGGYTSYSGTYSGYSYTAPTYGVVGSQTYSYTTYGRMVRLDILDAKKSTKDNPVKVFEGTVKSRGSSGQITVVMPAMIEALFKNFPGESGKSAKIFGTPNY